MRRASVYLRRPAKVRSADRSSLSRSRSRCCLFRGAVPALAFRSRAENEGPAPSPRRREHDRVRNGNLVIDLEAVGRELEPLDDVARGALRGTEIAVAVVVDAIGLDHRDDFRAALAAVLVSRREHQPVFEQAFALFWRNPQLLERMLANHSQIASAGELTDFGRQLLRVANTAPSWDADFFARQLALDFAEVGRGYLAQTRWRASGRPFYIDKRPGNYLVAGLIHAALPEAKILHLVRDPMDVAFSIWRARFGSTYAWSYDFRALATHYGQYRRLMDTWQAAYPGVILDVAYGDDEWTLYVTVGTGWVRP